jgi:hypothetical protein
MFGGDRNLEYLGGETVLAYFGADTMGPWAYLGIEASFFLVFFGLAVLTMAYVRHDKR